ncbi:hypothetical protein, partial [Bacillus cereus]
PAGSSKRRYSSSISLHTLCSREILVRTLLEVSKKTNTNKLLCATAVLFITLAMVNGETWKDKIVISLAVLIFTGFSLVWNTFV